MELNIEGQKSHFRSLDGPRGVYVGIVTQNWCRGSMQNISRMLSLWSIGLVHDRFVRDWARAEMVRTNDPSGELTILADAGPSEYVGCTNDGFRAAPMALTYYEEFALRALGTFYNVERSILKFARWIGQTEPDRQDDTHPFALLAQQCRQLTNQPGNLEGAVAHVRDELPKYEKLCALVVWPYVQLLATEYIDQYSTTAGHRTSARSSRPIALNSPIRISGPIVTGVDDQS